MEKLKVYLDTSVISHLFQDDTPEKMEDTRKLWELFKSDKVYTHPNYRAHVGNCTTNY